MAPKRKRQLGHGLVLLIAGCLFLLALGLIQPFYTFNLWPSDQFVDADAPSKNVVLVGIDDASLKTYGKWADWPLRLHAAAINNLSKAGETVIGFDVLFIDASPDDGPFAETG